MKRIFFLSIIVAFLFGCTPATHEGQGRVTDSVDINSVDNIAIEDPVSELAPESPFTSPDLKWLQLQGHVKQVVYIGESNYNMYYNYNREGMYISYHDTYHGKSTYKRDKDGKIVKWSVIHEVLYAENYTYNSDGYICKESYGDDESTDNIIYELNDKGWPISAKCETWYAGDEGADKSTISYSYPKIDDQGNWLVCELSAVGRTYYENEPFSYKDTITRKITYWK